MRKKDIAISYEYCLNCNAPILFPKKPCPNCGYMHFESFGVRFLKAVKKKFLASHCKDKIDSANYEESNEILVDTKICVYCGKTIKAVAKKCRYCKSFITSEANERYFEKPKDIKPEIHKEWINNNKVEASNTTANSEKDHQVNITKSNLNDKVWLASIIIIIITTCIGLYFRSIPPSCADVSTINLVIQIFQKNYLKDAEDAWSSVSYLDPKVENILLNGYDKQTKKYSCEAKVRFTRVVTKKDWQNASDITEHETYDCYIEYTSRITQDSNVQLVSLNILDYSKNFWDVSWLGKCVQDNMAEEND